MLFRTIQKKVRLNSDFFVFYLHRACTTRSPTFFTLFEKIKEPLLQCSIHRERFFDGDGRQIIKFTTNIFILFHTKQSQIGFAVQKALGIVPKLNRLNFSFLAF